MQRAAMAFSVLVGLGLGLLLWLEHNQNVASEKEVAARIDQLTVENQHLRSRLEELSKMLKSAPSPASAPENSSEINQLRGAITELRKRTQELETAAVKPTNQPPPFVYADSVAKQNYANVGFNTPSSSVQTVLWAISKMDRAAFEETVDPNFAKVWFADEDLPPGVMPGGFRNGAMFRAAGFRVTSETPVSENEMHVKVFLEGAHTTLKMAFTRVNGEWKWSGNW